MHHLSAKIQENRRKILAFGRFSVQWFLGRKFGYFGKPIIPLHRSCDSAPDGLGFSPRTRNSDRMPGGTTFICLRCCSGFLQKPLFSNSQTVKQSAHRLGTPIRVGCHPGGGPLIFAQGASQVVQEFSEQQYRDLIFEFNAMAWDKT